MKIAFLHPDLGIGGAERLVIDAAVGLQNRGHKVVIYTSFRDTKHCFDEAQDGSLEVRVRGDTIFPANLGDHYDALFMDQLSICIPLLKFFLQATPILFYCHFPDKLLSRREDFIKKLYRIPFDFLEGWTTGQADTIVVNSNFTASVFLQAFPRIHVRPKVVYPCVDVKQTFSPVHVSSNRKIVLSINRFERKKNIELAIRAFSTLRPHSNFKDVVLVLAGGYDQRVIENVGYHKELQELCSGLNLSHKTLGSPYSLPLQIEANINVYFLLSIPSELKTALLASSQLLAYTPANEHFGIVPIEASLAGLPVIAQDNGGPLESVEDGITGYSRPADPKQWAEVMQSVLFDMSESSRKRLGEAGRRKVLDKFSHEAMSQALDDEFEELSKRPKSGANIYAMALLALFIFSMWRWALRPVIVPIWHTLH